MRSLGAVTDHSLASQERRPAIAAWPSTTPETPLAAVAGELLDPGQVDADLACVLGDGAADGVFGGVLEGAGDREDLPRRLPSSGVDVSDAHLAGSDRAGLVEHYGVDAAGGLQDLRALDEDAELGAASGAHHERGVAAWDVHRAKVFGRCEDTTGIEPFNRLVDQVMTTEPYASARRVFWVVDNGSSHRGQAVDRLQNRWPTLRLIHLPVHASWLNQVEIYLSVVQRKVVAPNDFHDISEVEARLLAFQQHYEQIATPFEWRFTKNDLNALLDRIAAHEDALRAPAA
jgi:hypothetical protein